MKPHIPSVDRSVQLIRDAIASDPMGEGLDGINIITVALSAAIRSGDLRLVLRDALDPPGMPASTWRRLGEFLKRLSLLRIEAVVDLVAHPNAEVRKQAWQFLEQYGSIQQVESVRARVAHESLELALPMAAVVARI